MGHVILLVGFAVQTAGCGLELIALGAAGGTAGTVYVMGGLKDRLNAPVPKVRQAVAAGLKDLGLPIREDRGDKLTAHLESEFSDGAHVWITMESAADSQTDTTIRVGVVGDEARSRKILEALWRHL